MSVSAGKGLLTLSTRQLNVRWEETLRFWQDQKARQFEETYLVELAQAVTATLRALDDLDQLLSKIHADCE